jgi:hypothetical protein
MIVERSLIYDRGKMMYSEANLSHCHMSATNSIWTGLGSNLDHYVERPVTDGPSRGTTPVK